MRSPLHIEDAGLACDSNSCLAVGFGINQSALVSVAGGRVGAPRTVKAVGDYLSAAAIPGGGFVAVGEGSTDNRPLLTFTD